MGEYAPPRDVQRIRAEARDPAWLRENEHFRGDAWDYAYLDRFGYEEVGHNRSYETMVFPAGPPCWTETCSCGLPSQDGAAEDMRGYNSAREATEGHMSMCEKYAEREIGEKEQE